MKILLVNDDGYKSAGINALAKVLSEKHEIYLVSTLSQITAAGHGISLSPFKYKKTEHEYAKGAYVIEGKPVDCVKTAIIYFFKDVKFDLIISGINEGENTGGDMIYSGTVACALDGAYFGIKSFAVSYRDKSNTEGYTEVARHILDNIDYYMSLITSRYMVLNINYPDKKPAGSIICRSSINHYTDYYEENDGKLCLKGEPIPETAEEGSDWHMLRKNYITIVPLTLDQNIIKAEKS